MIAILYKLTCRCGEIGRRKGLKIPRWQQRTGSSPVSGTTKDLSGCYAGRGLFCTPELAGGSLRMGAVPEGKVYSKNKAPVIRREENTMSDMDDFYIYKLTNSGSGGSGGGKGFGCGWIVIVLVVILLLFFLAGGAGWDAIESLLAVGLLAFLFFRWIST